MNDRQPRQMAGIFLEIKLTQVRYKEEIGGTTVSFRILKALGEGRTLEILMSEIQDY